MDGIPWPQILLGGLLCYLGYPLFEASVLVFGLLAGGGLGLLAASYFTVSGLALVAIVLMGACVGMFLFRLFVRGGFALVGSVLGLELGRMIAPGLPLVAAGCAVAGAVLSLAASRRIIILGTALVGAAMLVGGGERLLDRLAGAGTADGARLAVLVLFVVTGMAVQSWLTQRG